MRLRRLLLAAAVSLSAFTGLGIAAAAPASAFCDVSEGCSPCGYELVIQGKNTRLEPHHC